MPRMIPADCPDTTESRAEISIFYELKKKLPDDWTVFHSLGLLNKNENGKILDAEIDFIIVNPKFGLLILEVKGGQISYQEGDWKQNGWKLDKSPAKQALNNKYALIRYLKRKLPQLDHSANFAHAVCFPDCYEIPNPPPECDGICITGKDIPYLKEALEKIMENAFAENKNIFNYQLVLDKLAPAFEYGCSLSESIRDSEKKIFRLTEQQCELLNFISQHKKALIKGCAGSGKTIMAVKKARELAQNGHNCLLLVYNSLLCEKMKNSLTEKNIRVTTYHDLCLEELQKHGINLNARRSDNKVWTEIIPAEFSRILKKSPLRFDAVIVDEGQDFRLNYWASVSELVKPDGWFYIFYDPDQNLYNEELVLPKLGNPFILNKNCRNSQEIFYKLKPFCSENVSISEFAPIGTPVQEFIEKSEIKRIEILKSIIEGLIAQNIFERQIVILGGHSLAKTCLGDNPRLDKFEIVENSSHDIGKIPYFTYMKYKGCEADAVILLDVDQNDPRWQKEALCTAISRAKHLLFIIRKN